MSDILTSFFHLLIYAGPIISVFYVLDRSWSLSIRLFTIASVLGVWVLPLHYLHASVAMTASIGNSATNLVGVVLCATGVRKIWRWRVAAKTLAEAKRLQAEAEQRALGALLAPHTLHNMLNVVYAATLSSPERAPSLVLELADLTRYLLEQGQSDLVPARSEWAFIEGYRRFALERASGDAVITLSLDGNDDLPVPALMLVSLFENAVKHGLDSRGGLHIRAELACSSDGFRFAIENKLGDPGSEGGKMGLELVRRRLEVLYPQTHSFSAHEDIKEGTFKTEIIVWAK